MTFRLMMLLALLASAGLREGAAADAPLLCCPPIAGGAAWSRWVEQARRHATHTPVLAAAEPGCADLRFNEFFGPIGDRGLEYTERMRALDGHRVRIVGFMVKQQAPTTGLVLLTPLPVATQETEYGFSDDLPATLLHVILPENAGAVSLVPGPVVLTGRLEIGPLPMPDGRNSVARLQLDPALPNQPLLPSALRTTSLP